MFNIFFRSFWDRSGLWSTAPLHSWHIGRIMLGYLHRLSFSFVHRYSGLVSIGGFKAYHTDFVFGVIQARDILEYMIIRCHSRVSDMF